MTRLSTSNLEASIEPQPAWEIAKIFPLQGHWSVGDYLGLNGNHLVEFTDGNVEVLEMPTLIHQLIVAYVSRLLSDFVSLADLGTVVTAPYKVRVDTKKFREPDIFFMRRENDDRLLDEYSIGADLVMEVVSESNRDRDFELKIIDYAEAVIPEYWIVDPLKKQISVLQLVDAKYKLHGIFSVGQMATSVLLPGFEVSVEKTFARR